MVELVTRKISRSKSFRGKENIEDGSGNTSKRVAKIKTVKRGVNNIKRKLFTVSVYPRGLTGPVRSHLIRWYKKD